jgi:hypothetical protein
MLATRMYLMLFTVGYRHLSMGVVTEHSSTMGKSVNDIHLCKNLRLGLWILLNLSIAGFLEIASLNSSLLKIFIAIDSGKQDLKKSRSSLKREKSEPNDFLHRRNFTNGTLFFSNVAKVIRNSRVKGCEPKQGSS